MAVLSFAAGAVVVSGATKVWVNTDLGRTPAEIEADQAKNSEAFWAHYKSWIKDQAAKKVDPRTLPVSGVLATVADPAPSLAEALKQSRLVVRGTVVSVAFRDTADCLVTVAVSRTLKGSAPAETIDIVLPNALMPDDSWSSATVGVVEAMPMLYPKDDVVLLLTPDVATPAAFDVQSWTGTYFVKGDHLVGVDGNPFRQQIAAMTEDEFATAVAAAQ